MAKLTTKYKCGDDVIIRHAKPTEGIVTAVFIRGGGRTYEISYTDDNGPTRSVCNEVELEPVEVKGKFGFGGKDGRGNRGKSKEDRRL
jgi:hypothetical protein